MPHVGFILERILTHTKSRTQPRKRRVKRLSSRPPAGIVSLRFGLGSTNYRLHSGTKSRARNHCGPVALSLWALLLRVWPRASSTWVRIGANAQEGRPGKYRCGRWETFHPGNASETGAARATVRVGGGVFSTRQVVIGRVFEDVNRNGPL